MNHTHGLWKQNEVKNDYYKLVSPSQLWFATSVQLFLTGTIFCFVNSTDNMSYAYKSDVILLTID